MISLPWVRLQALFGHWEVGFQIVSDWVAWLAAVCYFLLYNDHYNTFCYSGDAIGKYLAIWNCNKTGISAVSKGLINGLMIMLGKNLMLHVLGKT